MTEEQRNNPLHGVKLERLLTELVDHYGWDILASQININCFKSYPSIKSSLKFLRKTDWAREKLEIFYLYKFKRLPKPSDEEYLLPPRSRTIPQDQQPRSPAVITLDNVDDSDRRSGQSYAKPTSLSQPNKEAGDKKKVNPWGNKK